MNISIPESLRRFIEEKVRDGGYGSVSEYVRELIRDARERESKKATVRELLRTGLDQIRAGEFEEIDERSLVQFIEKIKANARNRGAGKASRR